MAAPIPNNTPPASPSNSNSTNGDFFLVSNGAEQTQQAESPSASAASSAPAIERTAARVDHLQPIHQATPLPEPTTGDLMRQFQLVYLELTRQNEAISQEVQSAKETAQAARGEAEAARKAAEDAEAKNLASATIVMQSADLCRRLTETVESTLENLRSSVETAVALKAENITLKKQVQVLETAQQAAAKQKVMSDAILERSKVLERAMGVNLHPPIVEAPKLPQAQCSAMYEIKRVQVSEETVDFGIGIVWKIRKEDLEKIQNWKPGQKIQISLREMGWFSSRKELRYCLTNTETKETFIAGYATTNRKEIRTIKAIDGNTLTIYLSDGSCYHAAPNGHAGKSLAYQKSGTYALIIKEKEDYTFVVNYEAAIGFSLLPGIGTSETLADHLYAVRKAEIDAAKAAALPDLEPSVSGGY